MKIEDLINICITEKRIVCLVGGGGKTTLMYRIAKEAAKAGKKVIAATTTHIMKPSEHYASTIKEVEALWDDSQYAVIGRVDKRNPEKLIFPDESLYDSVNESADLILFEADGAKRFPCKIPAAHEPVIADDCDLIIGVMGMTALGKRLSDCCFRFDNEGDWLAVQGDDLLDESIAVKILTSEKGTRKAVNDKDYIVVLNQCDDEDTLKRAGIISKELISKYNIESVCCCLEED